MDDQVLDQSTPAPRPQPQPQPSAAPVSESVPGATVRTSLPVGPQPESFRQGMGRGLKGEQYVVDEKGNMVSTRASQPSMKGTFGAILAGMAIGALHGASRGRWGGVPGGEKDPETGRTAAELVQNRDLQRRGQAQQDFERQAQVKKLSREEAESAAHIASLTATTARQIQEFRFAEDEEPGKLRRQEYGNKEVVGRIDKMSADMIDRQKEFISHLTMGGADMSLILTAWEQAHPHSADIATGKKLPTWDGGKGEDQGVYLLDVSQLKGLTLPKDAIYSTWSRDKKGNAVEQKNTLKAGDSMMKYAEGVLTGQDQLIKLHSEQKVSAEREHLAAQTAEAWARTGEAQEGAVLKKKQAAQLEEIPQLVDAIGKGKMPLERFSYVLARKPELLAQVMAKYPDFDGSKVQSYVDTRKEFTGKGRVAVELQAGDVAFQHLQELRDLNTNVSRVPGTKDFQAYNNKVDTVASELARFYGNDTIPGIAAYRKTLAATFNRDAAITTQARSMGDRVDTYETRWMNAAPSEAYQTPMPNISDRGRKARASLDPDYAAKQSRMSKVPDETPAVPANVTKTLAGVSAGRHTLSDNSVWDKREDGSIVKVQ